MDVFYQECEICNYQFSSHITQHHKRKICFYCWLEKHPSYRNMTPIEQTDLYHFETYKQIIKEIKEDEDIIVSENEGKNREIYLKLRGIKNNKKKKGQKRERKSIMSINNMRGDTYRDKCPYCKKEIVFDKRKRNIKCPKCNKNICRNHNNEFKIEKK